MYESVVMAGIGCGGIVHCSIFAIVVLLAVLLMLPTEPILVQKKSKSQ